MNFRMLAPTAPPPGRTISLHAPATGAEAPASITWPLRGRRLTSWPARTAKRNETAPLRQHAKHVCGGAGASYVTTPSGCFLDGLGFSWQLRLAPGDRASRQEPPTGGASAVAPGDPREAGEPGDIGVPPHTGARGAGDSARAPHRSRRPYGRYTFSVGAGASCVTTPSGCFPQTYKRRHIHSPGRSPGLVNRPDHE